MLRSAAFSDSQDLAATGDVELRRRACVYNAASVGAPSSMFNTRTTKSVRFARGTFIPDEPYQVDRASKPRCQANGVEVHTNMHGQAARRGHAIKTAEYRKAAKKDFVAGSMNGILNGIATSVATSMHAPRNLSKL